MLRIVFLSTMVNVSLQDGNTPLHIAASMGHEELTEMLLKAGSDTTEKNNVSSFLASGLSFLANMVKCRSQLSSSFRQIRQVSDRYCRLRTNLANKHDNI